MRRIGQVREVWRYPVSSVGGESLPSITVSGEGIVGDRRFALFCQQSGLTAAPEQDKRWRSALFITASQPAGRLPMLHFADGAAYKLDDPELAERLHSHFGFQVGIGIFGTGEMLFPVVSNRYTPAALHLVTTASLRSLAEAIGSPALDSRRFRPSVLIDTEEATGFVENEWIGHVLRIGGARVQVTEPSRRCGMTLIAQPGIQEQPEVLRGIMRYNGRNLGVYAAPMETMTIAVGDPVYAEI